MKKKFTRFAYGVVCNDQVWLSMSKRPLPLNGVGACRSQFEKILGRTLKEGEKIKFELREVV